MSLSIDEVRDLGGALLNLAQKAEYRLKGKMNGIDLTEEQKSQLENECIGIKNAALAVASTLVPDTFDIVLVKEVEPEEV